MRCSSKIEPPPGRILPINLDIIPTQNKPWAIHFPCGRTVVDKGLAPEKGIGLMATKAVCLFGFEQLGLKKIVGGVLKSNERIIKVDTRAGFYLFSIFFI